MEEQQGYKVVRYPYRDRTFAIKCWLGLYSFVGETREELYKICFLLNKQETDREKMRGSDSFFDSIDSDAPDGIVYGGDIEV